MTTIVNQVESVCACCGSPVPQIPGAHRHRRYCDNNGQCKQDAYRARRKQKRKQKIRERWPAFAQETLDYLESLMITPKYGDRFAECLAELISKERDRQHAIEALPDADELAKLEKALEEERAKSTTLLADYMQLAKKMSHLESQVLRFQRMKILRSRQSMLQELMVLGGRLKYAPLTDLEIGEGIDQWLDYIRGASDEDLAKAIAHGYYQADSLAMAAIEASDAKMGMQMRQRIEALERDVALRDARIVELEHGQNEELEPGDELSTEQIQELVYHARERQIILERQSQQITELEREVREKITEIHKLEASHSSTMFTMNNLLAAAQTAQREGAVSEQQLEKDLNAVRMNVANEALLKTPYGQALLAVKAREDEVTHLKTRIEKQYERRVAKQQARIEELEGKIEKQSVRKADATENEGVQVRQAQDVKPATNEEMIARLLAVGERLQYRRLLIPHISSGAESWQHFAESASLERLSQAIATAEHYYENLIYLDELEQRARVEAREKKTSKAS